MLWLMQKPVQLSPYTYYKSVATYHILMWHSESVIILTPSYQFYRFFTRQMLDIEADGQHTG